MTEPSHEAQQVAIKMFWGFPILMMRKSRPAEGFTWEWGRWRKARWNEVNTLNLLLMNAWRD